MSKDKWFKVHFFSKNGVRDFQKKKRPPKPILLPEELNEEPNEELNLPHFVKHQIVWQSKKRVRPKFIKVSE